MPADLKEAVDCLVADEFLCSVLGEHITTKYVEAKMKEWENYTTRVSQWEIDEYLYKYRLNMVKRMLSRKGVN